MCLFSLRVSFLSNLAPRDDTSPCPEGPSTLFGRRDLSPKDFCATECFVQRFQLTLVFLFWASFFFVESFGFPPVPF